MRFVVRTFRIPPLARLVFSYFLFPPSAVFFFDFSLVPVVFDGFRSLHFSSFLFRLSSRVSCLSSLASRLLSRVSSLVYRLSPFYFFLVSRLSKLSCSTQKRPFKQFISERNPLRKFHSAHSIQTFQSDNSTRKV